MANPTISDFRTAFSEFSDDSQFPDDTVQFWLNISSNLVNECRWGALYALGVELVTAHNLVLSARDNAAALAGGLPGEMVGPVASKAVDKVSISYSDAAKVEGAGDWALSSYGIRYLRLSRLMGAGVVQV